MNVTKEHLDKLQGLGKEHGLFQTRLKACKEELRKLKGDMLSCTVGYSLADIGRHLDRSYTRELQSQFFRK